MVKSAFFQIGKKPILLQKIQHSLHGLHVALGFIFSVNQNVIQVHNNKNIEFFGQNLVDIALEAGRSVE